MKHQAMLFYSTKCLYLCGRSSMKCINNGIDTLEYPNMGISNFSIVEAIQSLHPYVNYFKVVTRCSQPFTRL